MVGTLAVECLGESARHTVRRLEDRCLGEMGVAECRLDVGMVEQTGDDPQPLAVVGRDRRVGVAIIPDSE